MRQDQFDPQRTLYERDSSDPFENNAYLTIASAYEADAHDMVSNNHAPRDILAKMQKAQHFLRSANVNLDDDRVYKKIGYINKRLFEQELFWCVVNVVKEDVQALNAMHKFIHDWKSNDVVDIIADKSDAHLDHFTRKLEEPYNHLWRTLQENTNINLGSLDPFIDPDLTREDFFESVRPYWIQDLEQIAAYDRVKGPSAHMITLVEIAEMRRGLSFSYYDGQANWTEFNVGQNHTVNAHDLIPRYEEIVRGALRDYIEFYKTEKARYHYDIGTYVSELKELDLGSKKSAPLIRGFSREELYLLSQMLTHHDDVQARDKQYEFKQAMRVSPVLPRANALLAMEDHILNIPSYTLATVPHFLEMDPQEYQATKVLVLKNAAHNLVNTTQSQKPSEYNGRVDEKALNTLLTIPKMVRSIGANPYEDEGYQTLLGLRRIDFERKLLKCIYPENAIKAEPKPPVIVAPGKLKVVGGTDLEA